MNPVVTALLQSLGDRSAAGQAAISAIGAQPTPLADISRTVAPTLSQPSVSGGGGGGYAPGGGGRLAPSLLVEAARRAGFTGDALRTAVAVAMAESGGNPSARGVNSDSRRTVDRGLWQINNYWHREVPDSAAYDPYAAAAAAFRISGGGRNWSPWSTYNSGAYRRFL